MECFSIGLVSEDLFKSRPRFHDEVPIESWLWKQLVEFEPVFRNDFPLRPSISFHKCFPSYRNRRSVENWTFTSILRKYPMLLKMCQKKRPKNENRFVSSESKHTKILLRVKQNVYAVFLSHPFLSHRNAVPSTHSIHSFIPFLWVVGGYKFLFIQNFMSNMSTKRVTHLRLHTYQSY